jgi:hypothetical protein
MLPVRPEDIQVEKMRMERIIKIVNELIVRNYKDNLSSFSLKQLVYSLCYDESWGEARIPLNYEIDVCTNIYPKIKMAYETYGWNVELKLTDGPACFHFTKK